ncbi:hypothetical protein AAZV13_14G146900 [Glycine max]
MEGTRAGTATGSYKCGKPGHWLRDCPFSAPNSNFNLNPNPNSITATTPNPNTPNRSSSSFKPKSATKKPNMLPRTKPKLTPELLLSDDDLGYALRYFPRKFKYCGRGHEFVHKVEKVAATRRGKVRTLSPQMSISLVLHISMQLCINKYKLSMILDRVTLLG